jgi:hypothetical protein
MKLFVHLLTALLIVPNTASARQIQGSVFELAKEQNLAHFIIEPKGISDICSGKIMNFDVVRVGGGYYVDRTHAVMRSSSLA